MTDYQWYKFLKNKPEIDEVNFWQPGGHSTFQVLSPGEVFLFKLHSPYNYIVGGGFFAYYKKLSLNYAWLAFGEKNGASSIEQMHKSIASYRNQSISNQDYEIGCIILVQPFFFDENNFMKLPEDWKLGIRQGKSYDTTTDIGKKLWHDVQLKLESKKALIGKFKLSEDRPRYGKPIEVFTRLGQGAFRIIVTDMYNSRCAVTQERTLPALEASHIKPYAESGPHDVRNGILLRSDIHQLLDTGYVTISPDYRFEVSKRIREEFENGQDYYKMHGNRLYLPKDTEYYPHQEFIKWHNENKFRG